MAKTFNYSSKTIEMRTLKIVLVATNIKLVYKLQISFNFVRKQLSNLRMKLEKNSRLILTKFWSKLISFLKKSLILDISFNIRLYKVQKNPGNNKIK